MAEKIKTNGQLRYKNHNDQRRLQRTVIYDEKWRKFSQNYRKTNPFCVECLKLGNHNIHNIQVDHIIPLEQRPDLKYDVDNLQSLCRRPWCRDYFVHTTVRKHGLRNLKTMSDQQKSQTSHTTEPHTPQKCAA